MMSSLPGKTGQRFSVNFLNCMEQNRLQGWLTVANAIETGNSAYSVHQLASKGANTASKRLYVFGLVWFKNALLDVVKNN